MMMPSIFGENLFDDWMDFPFHYNFWRNNLPDYTTRTTSLMKTDVKEKDGNYEVDIDLPGFKKEDIKAKLENGYLTVSATQTVNNDEKFIGEIIELFIEFELEFSKNMYDLNKNYFKLGVVEGVKLNNEINQIKNDQNKVDSIFLDKYDDDFLEYLEENKMKNLSKQEKFKKLEEKEKKLKNKYPNISKFLGNKENIKLSVEEQKAILEILNLYEEKDVLEQKECFKLGFKEATILLKGN